MKHVRESLLSESAIVEFFSYPIPMDEDPKPFKPDLRRSPLQVLKDYTEYCGGDPELTAPHFIYVPPGEERKTIKCVTRGIRSPIYATAWEGRGVVWTRLLCCWDDPSEPEDGKKMPPWDTPTTGAAAVRVPAGEGISDPQEWTEDALTPRVPSQPQPQLWGYPRVFSFQIRADLNANAQTAHSIMRVSCCTSILEEHKTSLR